MGSLTSFSYKLEHASNHLFQKRCLGLLIIGAVFLFTIGAHLQLESKYWKSVKVPRNAAQIIARCENLKQLPGPPPEFYSRNTSDRYVTGTESVLIKNAKIWTGNENGKEIPESPFHSCREGSKAIGTISVSTIKNYIDTNNIFKGKYTFYSRPINLLKSD